MIMMILADQFTHARRTLQVTVYVNSLRNNY